MSQSKSAITRIITPAMLLACIVLGSIAATDDAPLAAPAGLTAANGTAPGRVDLTWDSVPGATHYRVGWIADADVDRTPGADWLNNFNFVDRAGPDTSYTVQNLAPGERYYFIVGSLRGRFGDAGDAWSSWADVTTTEMPAAPETDRPTDCVAAGACLPIKNLGTFKGTGSNASNIVRLDAGLYRATSTHETTSMHEARRSFHVELLAMEEGRSVRLAYIPAVSVQSASLVIDTLHIRPAEASSGAKAGNYLLQVEARGNWTVTIEQISAN